MVEILFLLLPLAFYSGWRAAKKTLLKNKKQQSQLSDSFVKGVNYLLSEEPDKALEVFLNYPNIDEYTAETFQLLGDLFRERGEVDRALRVHQNVIARSNLNAKQKQKAMFSLGQNFFAAGMLDRAESVFEELLESTNSKWVSKASICNSLRTIYEQTQDWHKAIEATQCLNKFIKKADTNVSTNAINTQSLIAHYYCELADQALSEGNLHEVDLYISKAQKSFKKSTRLMILEGDIAYHQKNFKVAFKHYLKAVKTDPRLLSKIFPKLDEVASVSGETKSLQVDLMQLYQTHKDMNVFDALVMLAQKHGVNTDYKNLIQSALENDKLNIQSILNASELFLSSNELFSQKSLELVNSSLHNHLQGTPIFRCEHCGYKMHDFLWRCPACNYWDTVDHI